MGLSGIEPLTSRLSGVRSNQLSYRPISPIDTEKCTKICTKGSLRDYTHYWRFVKKLHFFDARDTALDLIPVI
jgi:hypothetical protein